MKCIQTLIKYKYLIFVLLLNISTALWIFSEAEPFYREEDFTRLAVLDFVAAATWSFFWFEDALRRRFFSSAPDRSKRLRLLQFVWVIAIALIKIALIFVLFIWVVATLDSINYSCSCMTWHGYEARCKCWD